MTTNKLIRKAKRRRHYWRKLKFTCIYGGVCFGNGRAPKCTLELWKGLHDLVRYINPLGIKSYRMPF